jgi:hypothetical protein
MPNINEFIQNKEQVYKSELQKMGGVKPCSKCDEDVDSYFWDPIKLEMSWTCSKGHFTSFKVQ